MTRKKTTKGMIVWCVAGVSMVVITGIVLLVLRLLLQDVPSGSRRELRVKLLYQTDHQALRDACRELSNRARAGDLKPGMYYFVPRPAPEIAQFPKAILSLSPGHVDVERNGMVVVAMMGALDGFGVAFYPDDYRISSRQPLPLGHKQIIGGLWYYDDCYDECSDWQQRLDSLRPETGIQ